MRTNTLRARARAVRVSAWMIMFLHAFVFITTRKLIYVRAYVCPLLHKHVLAYLCFHYNTCIRACVHVCSHSTTWIKECVSAHVCIICFRDNTIISVYVHVCFTTLYCNIADPIYNVVVHLCTAIMYYCIMHTWCKVRLLSLVHAAEDIDERWW